MPNKSPNPCVTLLEDFMTGGIRNLVGIGVRYVLKDMVQNEA